MEIRHHTAHKRPLRILLVEDDQDTCDTTALLLEQSGYEVRVSTNGPAALEGAEEFQPDVVLLDIGLPGMDGWQLAKRFHKAAAIKRPFLIAITGYGRGVDRRNSADAGIDLHLVKPADPKKLLGILARFDTLVRAG